MKIVLSLYLLTILVLCIADYLHHYALRERLSEKPDLTKSSWVRQKLISVQDLHPLIGLPIFFFFDFPLIIFEGYLIQRVDQLVLWGRRVRKDLAIKYFRSKR